MINTNHSYSTFENKRVLITGANGYIGSYLTSELLTHKADVYTISRHPAARKDIKEYCLDITNQSKTAVAVKEINPEYIFHLAAYKDRNSNIDSFKEAINTNICGTFNICSAAHELNQLKSIICIGTAEEYGNRNKTPFSEEMREDPASPYSYTKTCTAHLANIMHKLYDLPVTYLRPAVVYGPGQSPDLFIPSMIITLKNNQIFKMSSGEQTRDFLYISDLIKAILLAAENRRSIGEIINIGTGRPVKLYDISRYISEKMCKTDLVESGALRYRNSEVMDYCVDCRKAEEILNWIPETSLEEGLAKTIEYFTGSEL